MRRGTQVIAALLVLLGLFWSGRESTHGVAAFGEHWWCALPLAAIAVGVAALITARAA
jgi:hypothetical protein